jgi:hypothetical protein
MKEKEVDLKKKEDQYELKIQKAEESNLLLEDCGVSYALNLVPKTTIKELYSWRNRNGV